MAETARSLYRQQRFYELLSTRRDLSGLQLRVAIMLVSLCDAKRGYAWPTLEQIANSLGASVRGVRKAVATLKRKGIFAVEHGKGSGHANRYKPNFDLVPEGNIYELKKSNASSPIDGPTSHQENRNDGAERGTAVQKKGNGCSGKRGTGVAAIRGMYPKNVSEESFIRTSAEAPPSGGDNNFLSLNHVHTFIRKTEQQIEEGCLKNMLDTELKKLADKLEAESEKLSYAIFDGPDSDAELWKQCGRLLDEVKHALQERDVQ